MSEKLTAKSCLEFVRILSSSAPVPGGGGAAALVGAIGMALGNMVGSLTVGKKKYASVEREILDLKARADTLQERLRPWWREMQRPLSLCPRHMPFPKTRLTGSG